MIRRTGQATRRPAVAAVEFAVCLPVVLTFLVGIWEVGRLIEVQQVLSNAAREGARQAASGQLTNPEVQNVVLNYLQVAGIPTANVNVSVVDLTSGGDVSQAAYLDRLQVRVAMPFQDVTWSVLSAIVPASFQLSTQSTWVTVLDKPYPQPPEPPVG